MTKWPSQWSTMERRRCVKPQVDNPSTHLVAELIYVDRYCCHDITIHRLTPVLACHVIYVAQELSHSNLSTHPHTTFFLSLLRSSDLLLQRLHSELIFSFTMLLVAAALNDPSITLAVIYRMSTSNNNISWSPVSVSSFYFLIPSFPND